MRSKCTKESRCGREEVFEQWGEVRTRANNGLDNRKDFA